MEQTPLPKRRRLNGYNSNKPFKSPVQSTPLRLKNNIPQPSPLQQTSRTSQSEEATPESSLDSTTASLRKVSTVNPSSRPAIRPFRSFRTQSSNACPSPQERQLLAENRKIERDIVVAKQDAEALAQAIALLTKDSQTKLTNLEEKWRCAARLAAEELFATAKDKVCRMGGVGALKDREQEVRQRAIDRQKEDIEDRKREFAARLAAAEEDDDDEEADDDPHRERIFRDKWEYDAREIEYNEEDSHGLDDHPVDGNNKPSDDYDDGDTYSMDMMLRSMGIDFDLIGYSKREQRWVG